ncbi:YbjN domain-containing protein [Pseudotabrizicola algicola]|uniref:YbjN domain-containing protein n=1 Tax=Pseudotabrizicola algicola TaxID=2709381 RepID=A0A6B3RRY4_9RHOB|nr:YbjN domain-containing protein [Pseudotabrizicola algicola]NEX45869.1 YbjN domain-containing protein [Pseudotabrizicola algicola]
MKASSLALIAALFPFSALCQDAGGGTPALIDASAPETVAGAMRRLGYRAELTTDAGGDPQIRSAAGGVNFSVFFYGCTDGKACRSIQFSAGFDTENGLDPSVANDWNRLNRYGKVFLDDEGDPIVEQDITLVGGMNEAMFAENLRVWERVVSDLKDHIDW